MYFVFLITVDNKRHHKIKKIDKTYAKDRVPQPSDDLITLPEIDLCQSQAFLNWKEIIKVLTKVRDIGYGIFCVI